MAVYRFEGSIPISGASGKVWHFGAEPSNGGKGVGMSPQASGGYCEPMDLTPDAAPILDLDSIERDLADVEAALARLDAGTYWTDEITGETIPTEVLDRNPLTRRVDGSVNQ